MAKPATASQRVAKAQARAVKQGGRIIRALLPPEAAEALAGLQASKYGSSATACIARALLDAASRAQRGDV